MVVVSGSWVKNVATYPTPANDNDMVIQTATNNKMSAKAILICRPNSHPFQERTLTLDQPVKVGRSVARARATSNNAIFDCKVLSRNHALLWYDNGKFYLQDTKSSNGTFVNNNRLSSSESEPHEVCSGDIVQFGVDVVENNRKVTHCCIVATLKLYLADGKEAKASPSITETSRQGLVPLDELYKLNEYIQEASQREQCLENKLTALQHMVEETRRSADESWQAYIGEERLLSRVATLENQLAQASKGVTDDRLRDELTKMQEEKLSYQAAAKEALKKLHAERLEAVVIATEEERAKSTAEQEACLIKEQLKQVRDELQEVATKLVSEQRKSNEEKTQLEQHERELQARLDTQTQIVNNLQAKLERFKLFVSNSGKELPLPPLQELEKCSLIYDDDMKIKEERLNENENCKETEHLQDNTAGQLEENHINLTVAPVSEDFTENGSCSNPQLLENSLNVTPKTNMSYLRENTIVDSDSDEKEENEKEVSSLKFSKNNMEKMQSQDWDEEDDEDDCEKFKDRGNTKKIDSKTLKYQFQSMQNELKRQIEQLEKQSIMNETKIVQLQTTLNEERKLNCMKNEECEDLKKEINLLQQKWRASFSEIKDLQDKICCLNHELTNNDIAAVGTVIRSQKLEKKCEATLDSTAGELMNTSISSNSYTAEQVEALEEELVILKEKFVVINNEKLTLNKNLITLQDQCTTLRNRSHNTMFFYIAPLVFAIFYLLINQHFS